MLLECFATLWWRETLAGSDPAILQKAVNANFTAQLNLFNVLTKCMDGTGCYLMVNGMAAKGLPQIGLTGILANAADGASQVMNMECQKVDTLPSFTQVMINSSVGHAQARGSTLDPNDFGRVFVAMALGKHESDEHGTTVVDDALYSHLVAKLN